jgi:DNA-binding SARP family transcriptional activator
MRPSHGQVTLVVDSHCSTRLALLGGFSIRRRDDMVHMPLSAQRLVAFLALRRRALRRVHVACVLWPDASEERAVANLRTTLWRLRQSDLGVVETTATQLALAGGVGVDVRDAADAAHRILAGELGEGAQALPAAGELLPDWYDEWVVVEREHFRQLHLHALEALCDGLVTQGRYARAVETGLAAVELDPLRESAHRALMQAHLAEGNTVEVVREFDRFSTLLRRLGMTPSPRMQHMAAELRVTRIRGKG